jgi:hypothetical protein
MEHSGSLLPVTAQLRRLRTYRSLANVLPPLIVIAAAVLAFRWVFPWLFSVMVVVWAADAFLIILLAIPWLVICCAFAFGRIKCPGCTRPFAAGFHLWVPKSCQSCGYDITAGKGELTSHHH